MKTTVEIANPLLERARQLAEADGTTLRAVIEKALRQLLEAEEPPTPFRLEDASVGGQGLQPEFRGKGWEAFRDAIYEGHGL